MEILELFRVVSGNLIPVMFAVLIIALFLRYLAYKSGKINQIYFNTFSKSVQKLIEDEPERMEDINDVENWLEQLMNRVDSHLPDRSFRFSKKAKKPPKNADGTQKSFALRHQSLKDYADGKKSVIISIKQQVDALKSPHPPNFPELTLRVLDQDRQWCYIAKFIKVDLLSRMFDILPGLFIVGGIFGTFLGITSALPKIASIDLGKLHEAAPLLNSFVNDVAFSMNTSIAGIACSVIITLLISLFPLDSLRNDVRRNMELAFEFMWYQVHGRNISRAEKTIIKHLREIHETMLTFKKPGRKGDKEQKEAS